MVETWSCVTQFGEDLPHGALTISVKQYLGCMGEHIHDPM
jgi:hypothetical protein